MIIQRNHRPERRYRDLHRVGAFGTSREVVQSGARRRKGSTIRQAWNGGLPALCTATHRLETAFNWS